MGSCINHINVIISLTEHLLDFNHSRHLSWLSSPASVDGHDPELVLGSLGHVGQRVFADLGGCSVALGPFHLVHLLHLHQVTGDH